MKHQQILRLCSAAAFAAVIYVFTAIFHIPVHTGYTHVGDGFIYLAACLLPWPYAAAAGAIGAGLADLLSGYAIWFPGTIIIKALTVFCFSHQTERIVCTRNLAGLIPAWALCIGGYFLYEGIITGNFGVALLGIPGYIVQVLSSTVVFLALGKALDGIGIKSRLQLR